MGQKTSKLNNDDIALLKQETKFSTRELQQWYKGFKRDVSTGELTKEEFIKIHQQFYPFGDPVEFATYAFEAFDITDQGKIGFKDFIRSLSIAARGTTTERLSWAFKMYDRDKDGYVSYDDLLSVVKSVYKMVGTNVVTFDDDVLNAEDKTDKIWIGYHKKLDDKNIEKISMGEFIDTRGLGSDVIKTLNVYNDLI